MYWWDHPKQRVQCNLVYPCDPDYKDKGFSVTLGIRATLSIKIEVYKPYQVFFYTLKQKKRDRGLQTLSSVLLYTKTEKRDRGLLPYHPAVMTKHLVNLSDGN